MACVSGMPSSTPKVEPTATSSSALQNSSPASGMPVVNMWWAHTIKDRNAMDEVA